MEATIVLSVSHQHFLDKTNESIDAICDHLAAVPLPTVAAARDALQIRQGRMREALERDLRFAQWLGLRTRAVRRRAARRTPEPPFADFFEALIGGPMQAEAEIAGLVERDLMGVRAQIEAIDAEAVRIMRTMAQAEAAVLAVVAGRDED